MTPDENTIQILQLDVGDGQTLYVHEWGKKDALPILFLHGGPGGAVKDRHKQRFEPTKQRVIFFDQRGCGQSTPYGTLENNTTEHLVEDIEKIANNLGLERFVITGGSWGSCLALAYAIKYPQRVHALVLQGVFTGSEQEIEYLQRGLYKTHFPDVYERIVRATPAEYHHDPIWYHMNHVLGNIQGKAAESAKLIGEMEGALVSLDDRFSPESDEDFDPTPVIIETLYLKNSCFMPDRFILENARSLTMPVWLVHGRYDFVCPPATAYELHKKLPNSNLIWTQAGHGNDRNNYEVMRTLLLQISQG